jgi:hypothetical protein
MPEIQMRGVLGHELMHTWMFQNGIPCTDPGLTEGSCNYATLMIMEAAGTPESKFLISSYMQDPDAAYGAGFRDVKRFIDTKGLDAWLETLRTSEHDHATKR